MYIVILSDHAKEQLGKRAGIVSRGALRAAKSEIAYRLMSTLRLGAVPNEDLGIIVYLPDGWRAVCYPTYEGTWVTATVMPPKGVEDEELEVLREGYARQQKGVS